MRAERSRRRLAAFGVTLLLAASCFGPGSGLDAWMRAPGGQFVEGEPAAGSPEGPPVVALRVSTNSVTPGERGKVVEGTLDPRATGLAIGLEGDIGHWVLPADLPNPTEPRFPSYAIGLDFARDLPRGEHTLFVAAADEDGRYGERSTIVLTTLEEETPKVPLRISLRWGNDADLDLHVVDPSGVEVFKGNINSIEPALPGEPPLPPEAYEAGGVLDFDSNAGCVPDGRAMENVVWAKSAPRGRYVVRVDAYSLCGETHADWSVDVVAEGRAIGSADGVATDADTRVAHVRGAGTLALEFELR